MESRRKAGWSGGDGSSPSGVLTMREACRLLNVHSNTLRRWSDKGIIDSYRIGLAGHRRFKAEDINALLVEQRGRVARRLKTTRD